LLLSQDSAKDVSILEMLKELQCDYDTPPATIPRDVLADYKHRAELEYIAFMQRMALAGDGNRKRTLALGGIKNLNRHFHFDKATQNLLKLASHFIRNNDRPLTQKVIQMCKNIEDNMQSLLPWTESEINQMLCSELASLKKRASENREEPVVSLYLCNEENE